jgi:3-deoxy-D-manno-octulosonate 8-phosphate phosphatase KdsC-like HAD superfamily phosphatase
VLQGNEQKTVLLRTLIEGLTGVPNQVYFVGDDLADLPVLRTAGLAPCLAKVKYIAHLIIKAPKAGAPFVKSSKSA